MEVNKELVALYEKYKTHVGNQQTEAAAMLTLAHVLMDLPHISVNVVQDTLQSIKRLIDEV